MKLKRQWLGIFFLTFGLGVFMSQRAHGHGASIGIENPLGGMRYLFVSPVDQQIWGIACPGAVEAYVGRSREEILNCGYTQSIGPVTMVELLRHIPGDMDPYTLEQALRDRALVPVASSRDKYYEVWSIIESLSGEPRPLPVPNAPACNHHCQPEGLAFRVDVNSQVSTIYIYATESQGHMGSFVIGPEGGQRLFYLNVGQKALLNLNCGTTTIYMSKALKDKIIINVNGGFARYFYL